MNRLKFKIRFPISTDFDDKNVSYLTDLINRVYSDAESGIWTSNAMRTTKAEVSECLRSSRLILAELDGKVIGSILVSNLTDETAEFGMLVCAPEHRGIGIGSNLVRAAEEWAKSNGCETMRLELLTPRSWKHPSKEFLKEWYLRIGYRPEFREPFEKKYPEKLKELATDCDFTVWLKTLR